MTRPPPSDALNVQPVVEATFGLDGGAMFGIVPKPLWERQAPADAANRIRMAARCLVVSFADRTVLVDTGMGQCWSPREREIYAVEHPAGDLRTQLMAKGIAPEAITDIVMTHLHFDHAGGLTCEVDGERRPAFPNATVHVQRENWAWAHHPTLRDAGSYRRDDFAPLAGPRGAPLSLLDGVSSLWDGRVEVLPMAGHTPGMQIVVLRDGRQTYAFLADLIPTRAHVPLAWVMGYDLDPARSTREKREILEVAIADNWILILQHEPDLPFVRVERTATDRYRVAAAAPSADHPDLGCSD